MVGSKLAVIGELMAKDIRFCGSADQAPSLPGAYVLAIDLGEPVAVKLGGGPTIDLPAGCYLYCGSAKGPGGLKARLSRHFRRGKPVHWHIDQLTERGNVLAAGSFPKAMNVSWCESYPSCQFRFQVLAAVIARLAAVTCCNGGFTLRQAN